MNPMYSNALGSLAAGMAGGGGMGEGMAEEAAMGILLQAKSELATLLSVSQAITAAAGQIAKAAKEAKEKKDEDQ